MTERKIIYVGLFTPENPSIGDHSQILAISRWFRTYFPNHKVIRFYRRYGHPHPPEGLKDWNRLVQTVKKDDLIFIHSSGDFGTLFYWTKMINKSWHDFRRRLISGFPNNKIIGLPVTVFYHPNENKTLEKDKQFYRDRKNLLLMCREPKSYEILANNLDCKVLMVPDFAFNLKPTLKPRPRKGALIILRQDHETRFNQQAKNKILQLVGGMMHVTARDVNWYATGDSATTRLGNITDDNRLKIVQFVLDYYQNFKVVVTDRLHAMVFSVITKTPCVSISDKIPHKSSGYASLVGNSVSFVNTINEIPNAIKMVTSKPFEEVDLTSQFTGLKRKIFDGAE